MKPKKPDNVVYSDEMGYHANITPYPTHVGAPVIKTDDIVSWKNIGIHKVNKEMESKFLELKNQYENLMKEYQYNEMVYNATFQFEPVVGEIYHLYKGINGKNFLSLIAPQEWNKEHLGTFRLNSDKKWILIEQ
ncbi:DUF2452 domain-containing protein [Flavobacterium aciduliphilum]|uniref:Uncharacterized protein DUF2452 n=1 Tax=Flavobacterium aciduliphilum TaxID=1101402 RepID=A0A328YJB9_9FLAO|nr:DUF2452 domain-containing protein [Flavobacterium aciduliphilum]RAR70677.1 uncharacterized protein DUF2452 [Flavobacterium aciduliphilum]